MIFCKFLSNASFYTSNFHYPIRHFSKVFFGQLFHLHNYVFILFAEELAGRALNIFRLVRKEFDIVCLWEIFFNCDAVKQKLWLYFLKWMLRTKWWNQVDRSSFKTWSNVQEGKSETNFHLEFLDGWHYSLSIPIYIYVWGQLFFRSFCGFVISLKAKREPIREEFKLGTSYSCDTQLVSSPIIPHSSVQCLVHTCVLVRAILVLKNAFAIWTPPFGTTMPICNISIWWHQNKAVQIPVWMSFDALFTL